VRGKEAAPPGAQRARRSGSSTAVAQPELEALLEVLAFLALWCVVAFFAVLDEAADEEVSDEPCANTGPAISARAMTGTSFLNIEISTTDYESTTLTVLAGA
jgi:hypothetical protein